MVVVDLYIRVSTDEQAERGFSQRDQEERLRKYCEIKGYIIRHVYIEDHSAKTFKRPEWQKYLAYLRKLKRNKTGSLVLFTKWDRFSRNAGDAYQMINTLRTFGVTPEAIEQPLDLSVPENKMMLAFYLAAPEVENDRRALNVFNNMRKARKEGRYMGTAPVGYINKISEDKKKYIAIREGEGALLKWAFEKIVDNYYNTEQIWKLVREKSKGKNYRFSKNNFWVAIRNPLYYGKIFVPPYKDEKGYLAEGQHEPLISKQVFDDVQRILDGRMRPIKTKIVSMEKLPLRGFLKCPNCERMLTGSASKSRLGRYYYYYHCTSSCGARFKAEIANDAFVRQLRFLSPKPVVVDLFVEAFKNNLTIQTKDQNRERKSLLDQIQVLNNRYQNALIKSADGEMEHEDFIELKRIIKGKIEALENELSELGDVAMEAKQMVIANIHKVADIAKRYENGTIEEKRIIIGSMFPEFLEFDGKLHRTSRLNSAVNLIYQGTSKLDGKKNGTSLSFLDLSQEVIPLGSILLLKYASVGLNYRFSKWVTETVTI
ncbi:recombinase family protein, partial [Sphingobacterium detergens]